MGSRRQPRRAHNDRLDRTFHALADGTRRALVARLAQAPAKVTDLAEPFAMSLAAVAKHLDVLERAGLIEKTAQGRIRRCALSGEPMQEAVAWLEHYRSFWSGALEDVARYVEGGKRGTRK